MGFQRVARLGDVPAGRGLKVVVDGVELGLFRVGDSVAAIENACPHAGYPLSEGTIDGCVVVCPAHGFEYDIETGFAPGESDGFPIPRFAVRVEDDAVWVDLEIRLNDPRAARARRRAGD